MTYSPFCSSAGPTDTRSWRRGQGELGGVSPADRGAASDAHFHAGNFSANSLKKNEDNIIVLFLHVHDMITSLSEQCQQFQCSSHKGAVEAAVECDASLCAAELQACSGLRGQGEWGTNVCDILTAATQDCHVDKCMQVGHSRIMFVVCFRLTNATVPFESKCYLSAATWHVVLFRFTWKCCIIKWVSDNTNEVIISTYIY